MVSADTIRAALPQAFGESNLIAGKQAGKVRDGYPLGDGRRLLVTTDRLSAFDRVLACVPFKGQVLNQLAAWWFKLTADIIPNHVLSVPDPNATLAIKVEPYPVEVIVRGYITGVTSTALWYRYSLGERDIYGYHFVDGLRKNQKLPEPIITPTTKAEYGGHDERRDVGGGHDAAERRVGRGQGHERRAGSLEHERLDRRRRARGMRCLP